MRWRSGLATETAFGTGAAIQGGASYIPQVARDLQTAPVIPPGAFPNGKGTGEQYGSEIPGWYTSLSDQESANTLAEWTAEQEQLRREAEEKAKKKVVDPLGTVLLGYKEMYQLATIWYELAHKLEKYSGDVDTLATVIDGLQEIGTHWNIIIGVWKNGRMNCGKPPKQLNTNIITCSWPLFMQ